MKHSPMVPAQSPSEGMYDQGHVIVFVLQILLLIAAFLSIGA